MKMNETRIVYLSVPESLGSRFSEEEDGFSIDPSIPIPVELPPEATSLDLESLSWEMIISGMLKVIISSNNRENELSEEDVNYYRRFVLAVKPDIRAEFSQAAILKSRNREFPLALEILAALEALFPGDGQTILNSAIIADEWAQRAEETQDEEEAAERETMAFTAWKRVLSLDPPFSPAFYSAAFFYMRLNNFSKARECLARFVDLSDDTKRIQKAKTLIQEIDKRELDDELFKEAFDAIRSGQEEAGIAKARAFLERHSEVWNAWFILGWGLRRVGSFKEASEAFRKAIEQGGDNCDSRNELAICLMETGDYPSARRELEQALRHEGENTKVISNLGVLALKEGKKDEAEGFFRTVLEIDENDQIALAHLRSAESP